MNTENLTMNALFAQMGLPNTDADILDFFRSHASLPATTPLHQAPFWTKSQAAFLQQAIAHDSEWCGLADELDTHLRKDTPK